MSTMVLVLMAGATMLFLAVGMAWILGWANRTFHVEVDPRVDQVLAALPGVNCGACGYPGCQEYAEAVVAGRAPPDLCSVGGPSVAEAVARCVGMEVKPSWPYRAVVHCGARLEERLLRMPFRGEATCAAANLVSGVQGCVYGCLGLGDCQRACPFDAIGMVDGLAVVNYEKCTGCGKCEDACPRHIISMVPFKAERMLVIACANKDPAKYVKAVCKVGCLGCRACERAAGDVFKVEENLSHINYDAYDPAKMDAVLQAVGKCPMKRIVWVGKPSPKDLEAVKSEPLPAVVQADFRTTVEKTEWRG